MSDAAIAGSRLRTLADTFAKLLLPLYTGPEVVIRIGSSDREYKFPKALLCARVPYFAAMFAEGHFREGAEQSTILEEIDGVLSTRTFDLLAQWVCLDHIVGGKLPPAEEIALAIEFARLADMYNIAQLGPNMAYQIRRIILANKPPTGCLALNQDQNTHCLQAIHITSGLLLPEGHVVRKMLAEAAVRGYLVHREGKVLEESSFYTEVSQLPDFAMDLLGVVKAVVSTFQSDENGITFEDPIDGQRVKLLG